jgi:hypothetical protein
MLDGNNVVYANDWLLADNKTGEVARFEIGLKKHRVWRSKDGYFAGSNFPSDPALIKTETDFDPDDASSSMNARHKRWDTLMAKNKGKNDTSLAQKFLADHFDTYEGKEDRNERGLCGHVSASPRGVPQWAWGPYDPSGTVSSQAADSAMAKKMALTARAGYSCGEDFIADTFLKEHPEFEWQRPALRDMKGSPWAEFTAGDRQP